MTEDDVRTYAARNPHLTAEQNEQLQAAYAPLLDAAVMRKPRDDGPLPPRLRAYAAEHPGNEKMIELADEMDKAITAWLTETGPVENTSRMKHMIRVTARARLHWCQVTGEPLV